MLPESVTKLEVVFVRPTLPARFALIVPFRTANPVVLVSVLDVPMMLP